MRLSSQTYHRFVSGLPIIIGLINQCSGETSRWKNSEYFLFPEKAGDIPTVHDGDTIHLKWASLYTQAYLEQYCNGTSVNKIPGLAGDGEHTFVVNSTWVSPCYWRYYTQESIYKYVESGYVYVTSSKTTPAVTWQPQSLGTACRIQSVTAGSTDAASTSTITIGPTTGADESSSDTECTGKEKKKITSGAGIGIGFVVGSAVAGLTAGFWTIWQRKHLKKTNVEAEKPHVEADGIPRIPAWELPSDSRPVELMTMRRFAELPSTPKVRTPNER